MANVSASKKKKDAHSNRSVIVLLLASVSVLAILSVNRMEFPKKSSALYSRLPFGLSEDKKCDAERDNIERMALFTEQCREFRSYFDTRRFGSEHKPNSVTRK